MHWPGASYGCWVRIYPPPHPRLTDVGTGALERLVTQLEKSPLGLKSSFTSVILGVACSSEEVCFFRFGSAVHFLCDLRDVSDFPLKKKNLLVRK